MVKKTATADSVVVYQQVFQLASAFGGVSRVGQSVNWFFSKWAADMLESLKI